MKADTLGHVRWERIYAGDYEQQTADTVSRRFCYLGEGVLYLSEYRPGDQGWTHRPLYILRDRQGSVTRIIDASGATVFSAYYDAWGRQTVSVNTIGFYRGYTGHEMLPEKGLINMNGRLYDPLLALSSVKYPGKPFGYWLEGVGSRFDMFDIWPGAAASVKFVYCEMDGEVIADQSSFGDAALSTSYIRHGTTYKTDIPSAVYDLQGRRIHCIPSHGIYIRGGRKYVR